MERIEISILFLSAYFLVGVLLAFWARHRFPGGISDFYTAPRRFGWFFSSFTYAATTYSVFMIIGLVGISYATGIGALGFELVYLVATLFFLSLFSIRVWKMALKRGWDTPSQMISDFYGSRKLHFFIAVLYILALSPYVAAQLQGIASAVEGFGFSFSSGVLVGFIAALIWTLVAGMWSVVFTDVFQGLWMLLASILFFSWLSWETSGSIGLGRLFTVLGESGLLDVGSGSFWSLTVFIGFTLPWIFFAVTNPQVIQRLYIPKDEDALKKMVIAFGVFGLLYTIMMVLIGLIARGWSILGLLPPVPNRDLVTPYILQLSPPLLSGLVFTSIIAASISTIDSIVLTVSSGLSKVLRERFVLQERQEKMMVRVITFLFLLGVSFIAFLRVGFIVELSVISSLFLLPLAPSTLYAWVKGSFDLDVACAGFSIGGGLVLVVSYLVYVLLNGLSPKVLLVISFIGLPLPFWVLSVSTILLLLGIVWRRF